MTPPADRDDLRDGIRRLCASFDGPYWRDLDRARAYPTAFVDALARDGWLSILIPVADGGAGLGLSDAVVVLREINRSGGNAAAIHAQLYLTSLLLRHASPALLDRYLPAIARGELRLQAFGVTEPTAGSDTLRLQTRAERHADGWRINGQKVFTSRAEHSDLLVLAARTAEPANAAPAAAAPAAASADRASDGLSLFLVDLRAATASGQIEVRPLPTMLNHSTTELFIQELDVPADSLIGTEGQGFRNLIDGWNAERVLIAAECLGDGDFFVDRATAYATERVVFGRPIGSNQGVQFPIAQAYAQVRAAELMTTTAAERFDAGEPCGPEANMAKLLASQASWAAANACLDAYGGYGFAVEYDIERKFRETRLYGTAPVSNNLVLAYLGHRVLGLPRSY
ncbi:MAG TPA: acyl-CoA dehydrogenase family protein [Candidatus Limnocylindrales bacterium]|nr:acyl-CoA dehydrogenase family protein [Candidatus Limnocylindrales bacterium]